MGKISPYDFRGVPVELIDFKEEVTNLLNFGKYSSLIVATPPTWVARNGEFVFMTSASINRIYYYAGNQWNYLEFNTSGNTVTNGGQNPGGSNAMVQYNSNGVFGADSGFLYRSQSSISIGTDMRIIMNSNSGSNTYSVYTTSNVYLEFYVDGSLRLQM